LAKALIALQLAETKPGNTQPSVGMSIGVLEIGQFTVVLKSNPLEITEGRKITRLLLMFIGGKTHISQI